MVYRLLYIEDDKHAVRIVTKMLTGLNYSLSVVHTGRAGIDAARGMKPDLILADMRLPDMTGLAMVSHIKACEECQDIPIIAVTANTMSGDRNACLEAGCDDYLSKPLMRTELMNALVRHLPRDQMAE